MTSSKTRHDPFDSDTELATIQQAFATIDNADYITHIDELLADSVIPKTSPAARTAVPLPPTRAALHTLLSMKLTGDPHDGLVLARRLRHSWNPKNAADLGITEWQQQSRAADPADPDVREGNTRYTLWCQTIVELIPDITAISTTHTRQHTRNNHHDTTPVNYLDSATYRTLDVDSLELVTIATTALADNKLTSKIEELVELLLPTHDNAAPAATRVPRPPITAVLVTGLYLRYINQETTAENMLWTLLDYWQDDEAQLLHITNWQHAMKKLDARAPATAAELDGVLTWMNAVLQLAADLLA